jgi:hypothetical protein
MAMGRSMDRAERVLLFGALGMLLVSAAIGDGSATGALGASGPALRAHVHAGSLGWITLAVLAVALRMATGSYGSSGSRAWADLLSWLAVAATLAFVVADAIGSAAARAWTGAPVLVVIAAFTGLLGWLVTTRRAGRAPWSVPGLGMGAALAVLLAASALGALAAGAAAPASLSDARSAALSVPFVVLAATSVLEWAVVSASGEAGLREPQRRVCDLDAGGETQPTTAGLVQVGALGLAAAALIAGVLTRNLALVEANVPLELGGIAIFAVRVGPALLTSGTRAGRSWFVTGAVGLAVDVGLVAHLVFEVGQRRYVTAAMIPGWLPFAVDHVTFVAVGTACLFGTIAVMTGRQEGAHWHRADALAAVGLVTGLAGTTVGIGAGSPVLEWTSSAVLGLAVLGAVAVAAARVAAIKPAMRLNPR